MDGKKDTILSIISLVVFIIFIIGAFSSGCIRCTNCGNDDTRLLVYANGTSADGVDYISCVGPAGCLGFGINSKCWPTECTYVKKASSDGKNVSGCVTYYNKWGCITNSDVKSVGTYEDTVSCLGISCSGTKYIETTADTTQAKEQNTCLGIGCGSSESTESKDYNSNMPRQFTKGCWGNE